MDISYYELYSNLEDAKRYNKKLATIIEFDNGAVVVQWDGEIASLVIHESLKNFYKVSVTGNRELVLTNCKTYEKRQRVVAYDGIFAFCDLKQDIL